MLCFSTLKNFNRKMDVESEKTMQRKGL